MKSKIFVYRDASGVDYPVCSDTEAVSHSILKTAITPLFTEYNASSIWGGTYTLETAIQKLSEVLGVEQKIPGVRVGFTNSKGNYENWEYYSSRADFNLPSSWRKSDSATLLELQEKVFPLSVSLNSNKSLIGVGDNGSVKLTWSVTRKDLNITSQSVLTLNQEPVEGTFKDVTIDTTIDKTETYTLTATYQGMSAKAIKSVRVSNYSYYGLVSETPSSLNTLTKVLVGNRGWTKTGMNLVNQRTCYAYPKAWGALTSIKDGNNFEYIGSYTKTELNNDKGIPYLVYTLTSPTTINNFKQVWQ